jgi:hypothetical protein
MKCKKCGIDKELNKDNYKPRSEGNQWHLSCRDCMRKDNNEWRKKNKSERNAYIRDYRKEVIDSAKTPCVVCGEEDPVVIEFHHLDARKDVGGELVSRALRQSKKKFLEEIKKCVCVCANCHRRIHAGTVEIPT